MLIQSVKGGTLIVGGKLILEMLHDSPVVSPNNSDDKGESNKGEGNCVACVKERNKSEWTVVEALMGMGSGQLKDDGSMGADDGVKSEDKGQEDIA